MSDEPVLRRTGLLLVSGEPEASRSLFAHGAAQGLACEWLEGSALYAHAPSLAGGEVRAGVHVPGAGVLEIDVMLRVLSGAARSMGAEVRTGVTVTRVRVSRERIEGLELAGGGFLPTPSVVMAAGAFSAGLAEHCGANLPLQPVRRHLVQLAIESEALSFETHPVVWRLDDETYYRPEAGGVLASPCDELAWEAGTAPADAGVVRLLRSKLERLAPALAHAPVRGFWACLRTFAPDRELVVGADPRVAGLYWLAGLGGRGMCVAPAAAEILAACMRGEHPSLADQLSPRRLLGEEARRSLEARSRLRYP